MSRFGEKHVIARGVILWDGVTRPESKDDGKGGKRTQFSLKVALMNSQPEVNEVNAISTDALNGGRFKGHMPNGGSWPIMGIAPTDFEGRLPAHCAFNAKTYRTPQVFDINNQEMPPQIYGPMLYPGAVVEVLVSAFDFDNKSKGIALSLDGIKIIDATAPRLPVGGVDAGAAFGGGAAPGQPAAGGYAPPPVQAGYQPPPVQPGYAPPPVGGQPGYAPPPVQPGYAPPTQPAHDYLQPPVGGQPGYAPPPPAAPPAVPGRQMTAKAAGQTYEAFIASGWNDQQLVANGYMV